MNLEQIAGGLFTAVANATPFVVQAIDNGFLVSWMDVEPYTVQRPKNPYRRARPLGPMVSQVVGDEAPEAPDGPPAMETVAKTRERLVVRYAANREVLRGFTIEALDAYERVVRDRKAKHDAPYDFV